MNVHPLISSVLKDFVYNLKLLHISFSDNSTDTNFKCILLEEFLKQYENNMFDIIKGFSYFPDLLFNIQRIFDSEKFKQICLHLYVRSRKQNKLKNSFKMDNNAVYGAFGSYKGSDLDMNRLGGAGGSGGKLRLETWIFTYRQGNESFLKHVPALLNYKAEDEIKEYDIIKNDRIFFKDTYKNVLMNGKYHFAFLAFKIGHKEITYKTYYNYDLYGNNTESVLFQKMNTSKTIQDILNKRHNNKGTI